MAADEDEEKHCYRIAKMPTFLEARRILRMPMLSTEQIAEAENEIAALEERLGLEPTDRDLDRRPEGSAFLCGSFGDPCSVCGDVSEVLCDFPIGHKETATHVGATCDRSLCERCAPTDERGRNFCVEHREHGPGMVLFSTAKPELAKPEHRPRLPKAPPANRRHRVLQETETENGTILAVLTDWTDQISARRQARDRAGLVVQSWDDFVSWHRSRWPLKRAPRGPRKPKT